MYPVVQARQRTHDTQLPRELRKGSPPIRGKDKGHVPSKWRSCTSSKLQRREVLAIGAGRSRAVPSQETTGIHVLGTSSPGSGAGLHARSGGRGTAGQQHPPGAAPALPSSRRGRGRRKCWSILMAHHTRRVMAAAPHKENRLWMARFRGNKLTGGVSFPCLAG